MTPREYVLLEYEGLADGINLASELCPACKGGDTGERTLSVARKDGRLMWICHRASCPFRGSEWGPCRVGELYTRTPSPRGVTGRDYIRTSSPLPDKYREMFTEKYSLEINTLAHWGIGWAEEDKRVVMPVRNRQGEDIGAQLRSYEGANPKTITHTEACAVAWYARTGDTRHLIIVEDQVSAMRLWQRGVSAVALLGTHLNEEMVSEIRKTKFKSVVIALDNDAIAKSVQFVIKFRSYLPMLLLPISKDIKDQTERELTTTLSSLT